MGTTLFLQKNIYSVQTSSTCHRLCALKWKEKGGQPKIGKGKEMVYYVQQEAGIFSWYALRELEGQGSSTTRNRQYSNWVPQGPKKNHP